MIFVKRILSFLLFSFIITVFTYFSGNTQYERRKKNSSNNESNDDIDVLALRAAADETAFRTLYRRIYPKVAGYFFLRTKSHDDAEDLAADTFLRITDNIDRFDPARGSFLAWIFTIAHNRLVDHYARRKKHTYSDIDAIPLTVDETLGPEHQVFHGAQMELIIQALNHITGSERTIIEYKYFLNMRNREIAQVLKMKETSVSAHLSRALKKLAALVEQIEEVR